jgi:hypothetical protein
MEFGGALDRLREFQLAEMPRDVAQGRVGRKRLRAANDGESDGFTVEQPDVDWRLEGGSSGCTRDDGTVGGRSWLLLLCIEFGTIFGR